MVTTEPQWVISQSNKNGGCEIGGTERAWGWGEGGGSFCQCHKPLKRCHIFPLIDQFSLSSVGQQVEPNPHWWGTLDGRPNNAQDGTHQWVPFSLGSHCLLSLLSTGTAGEQHNGVAGPLRLILMSYYSSPHYPCYWLVWSQPEALRSNNKQSFFSLLPSHPTDSHIL